MKTDIDKMYEQYLSFCRGEGKKSTPPSLKQNNENSIILLKRAIKNRRISFVLGAGISYECGIPMWKDLVRNLIAKAFPKEIRAEVYKTKISEARKIRLLEGYNRDYRIDVVRELYKKTTVSKNSNLHHLAKIILYLSKRKYLQRVITYNFDDLLREEIRKISPRTPINIVTRSEEYSSNGRGIQIVHPHGHLPREANIDDALSCPIVFSEIDYHRHFSDHTFWTNTMQISTFCENSCLFVGVSFEDPNHRRLLDLAYRNGGNRTRHVAVMKYDMNNMQRNFMLHEDLISLGIAPYWVKSYRQIPNFLSILTV